MNILIASNSYPTEKNPTHQVFVRNIRNGLNGKAHADIVYNRYFDFVKSPPDAGGRFTAILKAVFLLISYLPYILYKARKYDLIYSHAPVLPGFYMLAAARLHNLRHVTYVHGSVNIYAGNRGWLYTLAKYTMRRCSLVVTNSRYMQRLLEQQYGCSSTVITPGYQSSLFRYQPAEKTIDLLFAGSAVERKGVDVFLRSLSEYRTFYEDRRWIVHLCCEGLLKKKYDHFIRDHSLGRLVHMEGRLEEEPLADRFRRSKIVVFPSRFEPFGLVGVEAIACGALLVASDTGGIREFVKPGTNGFLFENGNPHDLHKKIVEAMAYYPVFAENQPEISSSVAGFTLDRATEDALALFRKILT